MSFRRGAIVTFILFTLTLNVLLVYTVYSHLIIYEAVRKIDVEINLETEILESYSHVKIQLVLNNPSKASFDLFSIFSDLYLNKDHLDTKVLSYERPPLRIEANSNTSFLITYEINKPLSTEEAIWTIRLYLTLYSVSLPLYVPLRFTKSLLK